MRNFTFLDRPDHIELVTESPEGPVPVPFPMPLEDWPKFWKHGQWNELRARIVGNPPHITTWIKGVKFMDWTEPDEAASRQGQHRAASSRWRRFHQAVCPLPQPAHQTAKRVQVRGEPESEMCRRDTVRFTLPADATGQLPGTC